MSQWLVIKSKVPARTNYFRKVKILGFFFLVSKCIIKTSLSENPATCSLPENLEIPGEICFAFTRNTWQLPSASIRAVGDPSFLNKWVIDWTSPVHSLSCITVLRENTGGQKSLLREVYRNSSQEEFGRYWTRKTNNSRLTWKQRFNSIIHFNKKKGKKPNKTNNKTPRR